MTAVTTEIDDRRDADIAVLTVTRPARGEYAPDVLALGTTWVGDPGADELLVEVLYLSIDPTNRNWLKLEPVNTLVDKVGHGLSVGAPMMGEAIVRVLSSRAAEISTGDGATASGLRIMVKPAAFKGTSTRSITMLFFNNSNLSFPLKPLPIVVTKGGVAQIL